MKYKVLDQFGIQFLTFTVVDWCDVFIRKAYKDIIIDSLTYCQEQKGLVVYSFVIMTSHLHLVVQAGGEIPISDIIRDFKRDLQLPILVNQNVKGLGKLVFEDAFEYFNNSQGIDGIYGLWLADDVLYADYGGLSLNLSRFLEALDQTMPQNAAAFETITGQWAASKGFNNVEFMRLVPEVPYPGQGYTEVHVIFQP